MTQSPILITGATGKTGRRIVQRLEAQGYAVRQASRQAAVPFDWNDAATWDAALDGVETAYLCYSPDLAVPGATATVAAFVDKAIRRGLRRLVLLSGRGEEEAQRCERLIQRPELEWTVVRASWFSQNFSEGPFVDMILNGQVALPAGDVEEPFIDADDIAEVAVAALVEDGHAGQIYEVTGPRLLTFAQVVQEISEASGRSIDYIQIPNEAFINGLEQAGLPSDIVWLMGCLFTTVLDGRNAHLQDGVRRALGREPRDFADYARRIAATGQWKAAA